MHLTLWHPNPFSIKGPESWLSLTCPLSRGLPSRLKVNVEWRALGRCPGWSLLTFTPFRLKIHGSLQDGFIFNVHLTILRYSAYVVVKITRWLFFKITVRCLSADKSTPMWSGPKSSWSFLNGHILGFKNSGKFRASWSWQCNLTGEEYCRIFRGNNAIQSDVFRWCRKRSTC